MLFRVVSGGKFMSVFLKGIGESEARRWIRLEQESRNFQSDISGTDAPFIRYFTAKERGSRKFCARLGWFKYCRLFPHWEVMLSKICDRFPRLFKHHPLPPSLRCCRCCTIFIPIRFKVSLRRSPIRLLNRPINVKFIFPF